MGQVGYGELGIINSTIGMMGTVGGLGLGLTATKYVAEFRHTDPEKAGRTAGLTMLLTVFSSAIVSTALLIFAQVLASETLNAPHLADQIRLASIVLFLSGVDAVQIGILSGFEAFRAIARITLLRGALSCPLTILGVWFFGLSGAVGAMGVCTLVIVLVNCLVIRRVSSQAAVPICYTWTWGSVRVLWSFSLPAFLVSLLNAPATWVVNSILVSQHNGYSEMGLLNAASQWMAISILVPWIFSSVAVAIQSNLIGSNDYKTHREFVKLNMIIQSVVAMFISITIVVCSQYIMSIYGQGFKESGNVLAVLAIGWFFLTPGSVMWNTMVSTDRVWQGFVCDGLGSCILILVAWKYIYLGAVGVGLAYLVSSVTKVILQVSYIYRSQRNALV
jgi:O-antigen/teichoic acid export membrane protein